MAVEQVKNKIKLDMMVANHAANIASLIYNEEFVGDLSLDIQAQGFGDAGTKEHSQIEAKIWELSLAKLSRRHKNGV